MTPKDMRELTYNSMIQDIERDVRNAAIKHKFEYNYDCYDDLAKKVIVDHFKGLGYKTYLVGSNEKTIKIAW